jgi:hypothetical protein
MTTMRIRMDDGREFVGTPTQIVTQMQSIAFGRDNDTLSEYIEWVQRQTQEFMGVDLKITGQTGDEKADSLVNELLRTRLATPV